MNKLPALFVGHGNPMNVLDAQNTFNLGFKQITQTFEKPKAILMISAHWYSSKLQITSGQNPELIYDFHGFPEELSQVSYPAPGSPELAEQIKQLLLPEQAELNPNRGFDHGMWSVLKYLYPNADIPVVQLSIHRHQPAQWHFELAQKLKPLRKQGVLIIGSGNIVHNLRAISWQHMEQPGAGYDWAFAFHEYINKAIADGNYQAIIESEKFGNAADLSVPTPEHYLPLLYIVAQRDNDEAITFFNDEIVGGSLSMTSIKIG
ncbi:4,5-DOPA dioxygenase extradiol [Mannheimia granulomatis]|uniref:4,5-DOPA dioxygenase extradiol n=1 Tax=Mannheimia granulomatis TaxID=85402 RepID=A0A6G8JH89_9PAST|nr:4,5-DOPA dioxygenase extradiol [Mannheimia granulomatis]QIM66545.1 4,5-DOPA dioxygenase extradiol [Mannheimia granulomatis]